jgi:amidase
MAVRVPTPTQLRAAASEVGLDLTDADVASFIELMKPGIAAYNVVDAMADNLPPVRYPRTPGYRPTGEENRHNAGT